MKEYFKNYSRHYNRMGNGIPDYAAIKANLRKNKFEAEWLPKDHNAIVLDVGCGGGILLLSLWESNYKNIMGIDISNNMCEIARENLPKEISIINSEAIIFLRNVRSKYDLITLFDMIEHMSVDQAFQLLKRCHDALKPEGNIVIRTPNMANTLSAYSRHIDITHVQGYTEWSLFQLLDATGFQGHRVLRKQLSLLHPLKILSGIRYYVNETMHRLIFLLRGQNPQPSTYEINITIQSWKKE